MTGLGRRDSAHVITVMEVRGREYPGLLGWALPIPGVPHLPQLWSERGTRSQEHHRDVRLLALKLEEEEHKPGNPNTLGKARTWVLPLGPPEGT